MAEASAVSPWYRFISPLRILGTPAPVFPGYEIDIADAVDQDERADALWHLNRARGMLRDHPEIRDLMVREPSTAFWCLLYAGVQIGLAVTAAFQPLWVVVLLAYVFGSYLNICLFNLAHDCNHSLVFRKKSWNRWLFTLTSLPMLLPGHHSWWIEHHVHHNSLGSHKDFIVRRRQLLVMTRARVMFVFTRGPVYTAFSWLSSPLLHPYSVVLVTTQVIRSAIGLTMYAFDCLRLRFTPSRSTLAVLGDEHLVSGYERYRLQRWAVAYAALSFVMMGLLFAVGGWKSVLYLMLAQVFMTGFLHPWMFGLILSNSHFHGQEKYQPSSSYYGWLNWITFNFGLHTEHHDLATIPWSRLGELRKLAPEYYDHLVQTPSYARLALQFTFCSRPALDRGFVNHLPDDDSYERLARQRETATSVDGGSVRRAKPADPAHARAAAVDSSVNSADVADASLTSRGV